MNTISAPEGDSVISQILAAYVVSLVVYQGGLLLGLG